MQPDKIEEIKKLELPRKWQLFQLFAAHIFTGSLVACFLLYWDKAEFIITKAFNSRTYAVIFGIFFMTGIVSGFFSAMRGMQILVKIFRLANMVKNLKDDE
jgi:ABC-type thiamin/hydroxymethylpyrimidine transport system permease subunit